MYRDLVGELDELIAEAGRNHVIPPQEDLGLLERLHDPRVLARAKELLQTKDKQLRHQSILCIERIGFALRDQQTAELLLHHADTTKDKYEAATALDGLANLDPPQPLPAEPLLRLVHRREWLVWHAAVQCLHLAPANRVEQALLDRMDADRYGLVYVARELRYMRSAESIRALERLLDHQSLDVRCVSLDSLGDRLGEGVVPYARRFATGRQWQEKAWAEMWLGRFGDAEDVPFMSHRLKSLVSGRRQIECEPPEVSFVVPFLLRHAGDPDPRARAALDAIRRSPERLLGNERAWLEQHEPEVLAPT
jgi:HEAT repeat protein